MLLMKLKPRLSGPGLKCPSLFFEKISDWGMPSTAVAEEAHVFSASAESHSGPLSKEAVHMAKRDLERALKGTKTNIYGEGEVGG